MSNPITDREVSIYIHIPFCIKSRKGQNSLIRVAGRDLRNAYLAALEREMNAAYDMLEGRTVRSIYVGGGIATVLSPDKLAKLLLNFKRRYETAPFLELTIAASPETLISPCLSGLNVCGFNRLSVEVLSSSNKLLEYLGASYRLDNIEDGLTMLGVFKYTNINADVMYGIPEQTTSALRNTLTTCTGLKMLGHITLKPYELAAEEGVSQEELRLQYEFATEYLNKAGFTQYAAGRFAKEGMECRFLYYDSTGMERIGFGLGARSFIDGYVYQNTTDMKKYIDHAGEYTQIIENVISLDDETLKKRFAATRLQLAEGFGLEDFQNEFGVGPGEELQQILMDLQSRAFIHEADGRYMPTQEGMFRAAEIQNAFFT